MPSQLNKYKAGSKKVVKVNKGKKSPKREMGRKWDGTSRPVTNEYRQNWKDIFEKEKEKEKEQDEHGWSADVEFDQAR